MKIERLFDIARNYAENFPKADMFATKRNGKWEKTSTAEFISLGNKFSRGLLKLGISPGDKISLITSATCTEWAAVDFGALQIGVITVPVYPTISPADYEFIFNDAEIKYCFVSDKKLLQKVEEIKQKYPACREFLLLRR